MSKDMNNEHEKALEKELQQKLKKGYSDASEESTSSELDASIMAMAQQEVDARDQGATNKGGQRKSWWERLKMPVSVTAALVVTVGIARFMVELGGYEQGQYQASSNSENGVQYRNVESKSFESATEVVMRDEGFADGDRVAAAPAKKTITRQRQALEAREKELQTITVTGARISREDLERARQQQQAEHRVAAAEAEALHKQVLEERVLEDSSELSLDTKPVVEDDRNQMFKSESNKHSGRRELVDTPYLPAKEWLSQIAFSLDESSDHKQLQEAKEQWSKFKQVYPDYPIEKSLRQRLDSLEK